MNYADLMTQKKTDAAYLFLILWKAWRSVEKLDRQSINRLDIGCFSDFAVLESLLHKGPLSISELGNKAGLTSGSITTAVQRLEKRKWIERESSPFDGRSSLLHLTDIGREVISEAFIEHTRRLELIFNTLDREERSELARLLKKVGRTAEAAAL